MGIDWEEYYGVVGLDDDALRRATEDDYFADYDNDEFYVNEADLCDAEPLPGIEIPEKQISKTQKKKLPLAGCFKNGVPSTKKNGLKDTRKTKEEWRRDFLEKKLTPIGFELENKYSLDGACEIAKALHTFNNAVEALDKAGNTKLADKLLYFLRQASKDRVSLKTSTECACPIPF